MIKNLYNLTVNEIIKILKRKSMIIISIIIFIIAFVFPFIINSINNESINWGFGIEVEEINATINNTSTKTIGGKIKKEFLEASKSKFELLTKYKIPATDWRYQEANNYYNSILKEDALKYLKQGVNPEVILGLLPNNPDVNIQEIKEALEISKGNINNEILKATKETENIKEIISKNDYLNYLNLKIKSEKNTIAKINKNLDVLNNQYEKNKNNNAIKNNIDSLNIALKKAENSLKISQYRLDNKVTFSTKDWRNNTLNSIINSENVLLEKKLTQEEYATNQMKNISYSKYEKIFNNSKTKAENNIKESWYSLNHNIPNPKDTNSSRNYLNNTIPIIVVLTTLLAAIIAGSIVSKEFITGSIRLLLIRPVSRVKILISKLLGSIIISYIILFIGSIFGIIGSGIAGSFSDYTNNVVMMSSDKIIIHNYFITMISHLLFLSLSLLFIICIAFLLSTITRSTAVSVAVSIILFIGSFIIVLILFSHNYYFIGNILLPYINLTMLPMLNQSSPQAMLNNFVGGIELTVSSIIFIIISIFVFKTRDITN